MALTQANFIAYGSNLVLRLAFSININAPLLVLLHQLCRHKCLAHAQGQDRHAQRRRVGVLRAIPPADQRRGDERIDRAINTGQVAVAQGLQISSECEM